MANFMSNKLSSIPERHSKSDLDSSKLNTTTSIADSVTNDELSRLKIQNELILQAAGEGIYGLNCQGQTTFLNNAASKMLGWSVDELIGQTMHSKILDNSQDCSVSADQQCPIYATIHSGEVSPVNESLFYRKDGSFFPAEFSSTPIYENNQLKGAVVVFRDITERKQTEQALQQALSEKELILNAAGEGIYGIDMEGCARFVNPAASEMTGWSPEETIGSIIHEQHHHSHCDGSPYPRDQCPIYAAIKDREIHHVEDEVFWRKDGSSFPVEYTSTPIFKDQQQLGAVVVFKDISKRKKIEQELQQAFSTVEKMKQRLEAENLYLQEEIRDEHSFKNIVGQSNVIKHMLNQIELVAPTFANVLISGESGTGKELIARAIHQRSERSDRPLIRVNCAAIPRELFESEFFGHVKGSFTGAVKDRAGRFELADGGTIFLDEVGEIPIELQSKLLRVLQEGQFERVGEEKTRSVDVRIIAATNRRLKDEVEAQKFREDLYFRLNVFPIEAIPLRKRIQDIPLLAQHFITQFSHKLNRPEPRLSKINVKQLQQYHWRGNIRELQNVIERAMIVSKNNRLQFDLIPDDSISNISSPVFRDIDSDNTNLPYNETERLERDRLNIKAALEITKGKVSGGEGAATLLGIKPTTLASRMKTLGIK